MSTTTALSFLGNFSSRLISQGLTSNDNIGANEDYTIEWWQKFTGNNPNPFIFGAVDKNTNKLFGFNFGYTYQGNPATAPDFDIKLTIADIVTTLTTVYLNDIKNKWIHFAISRYDGTIRVFMNGNQIGSNISDSTELIFKTSTGTGNSIYIGNNNLLYNQYAFGGLLYNFIWIKGNSLYSSSNSFTPSNNISRSPLPTGTKFILSNMTDITTYNFTNNNYYVQDSSVTLSNIATTQAPTITFSSIPTKTYGDAPFSITSLISSNSAGAYTYSSSDTTVATISATGTITILKAAPTGITITVNQEANGNYTAGSATSTLTINKATTTITFRNITEYTYQTPTIYKTYGTDTSFSLLDLIISNSDGGYTYGSGDVQVAPIDSNGIVTINSSAPNGINMQVTQLENENYAQGIGIILVIINRQEPTITFNLPTLTYGTTSSINLANYVTSTSSGAFTFTSSNTNIASISETTLSILAAGSFTITASQVANGNYSSKSQTSSSITVNTQEPTITLNFPSSFVYGIDNNINLTQYVTSTSSGAFTFTSSNTLIASISESTLSILDAGNFTITASQVANGNYSSKSQTSSTITVKSVPTVSFNLPSSIIYGSQDITLSNYVSSTSSGALSFTSSNASIGNITGNMLKFNGIGNINITLNQASTSTHHLHSTTKTIQVVAATKANPLNVVDGNHLVYAVDVLNIPFINVDMYDDKLVRNNTLNTNKLFTNTNNVVIFSQNEKNKIMY